MNEHRRKAFSGVVFCEDCLALVGETDECLCILDSARIEHDPVDDPNRIFCPCGNKSLAQLTDHICSSCEDVYTLCPGCSEREVEE